MERLERRTYCTTCCINTNHEILKKHKEEDLSGDIQWIQEWLIVSCLGCETISFVEWYGDSEMVEMVGNNVWEEVYTYKEYPQPPEEREEVPADFHEIKSFQNVAVYIKELYRQVVKSYNDNHLLLASSGVRSLIEAICLEAKIKDVKILDKETGKVKKDENGKEIISNSLESKINELNSIGLIVEKQSQVLQKIRKIGNNAVHEIKSPSRSDVKYSIEIIESIIKQIYELDADILNV